MEKRKMEKSEEFDKIVKQTVNPLKAREYLLDNAYLSDVTFILGHESNEQIFYGHKLFFITASPTFHDKFWDSQNNVDVKIRQIDKTTFTEIARFVYTDNVRYTNANMFQILAASRNLKMKFLVEKTIDAICKSINAKTVFKILIQAKSNILENMKITKACFEYIEKDAKNCLASNESVEIGYDLLCYVLQTCKIDGVLAKTYAFRWASHACETKGIENNESNQKFLLDDALNYIQKETQTVKKSPPPKLVENKENKSSNNTQTHVPRSTNNQQRNNVGRNVSNSRNMSRTRSIPRNLSKQRMPNAASVPGELKFLTIVGEASEDLFKEAVLHVSTTRNCITLKEIHFYIPNPVDTKMQIRITHCTGNLNIDLFCDEFMSIGKNSKYIFKKECILFGNNRSFIIKTTFENNATRGCLKGSTGNSYDLKVTTKPDTQDKPQIISRIIYTVHPDVEKLGKTYNKGPMNLNLSNELTLD